MTGHRSLAEIYPNDEGSDVMHGAVKEKKKGNIIPYTVSFSFNFIYSKEQNSSDQIPSVTHESLFRIPLSRHFQSIT